VTVVATRATAVVLAAARAAAVGAAVADKRRRSTSMIRMSELPSGLNVVTERMPEVCSVTLGFWVAVGARDEEPEQAGASHFLEHLLFKGSDRRSAAEIAEAVDAVGGELNAFTARDHTAFHVRLLATDLPLGLDILSEIMWRPAFRPEEIEAERQVILEELLMQADEPEDLVQEMLAAALWPDHPLGREVLGDEATVKAMGADDLRAYHEQRYRPGVTVLAAAGLVDHDGLVDAVTHRLAASGRAPGGERPARQAPVAPAQPLIVRRRHTEQAHLVLGLPWLTRHDPDRHAASLLTHIFGGGASSRLFQEVRERRGLAYSVYAYRTGYDDAGVLCVYAGTAPARAAETLKVVSGELERLADGVTERELDVARGGIIGSMALGLEDSGARMHRIGRSLLLHGDVPAIDDVTASFARVTTDDIRRVAGRLLEAPRTLAVVSPLREDRVARWVA
jgi:predicted Zn-dependent peptidase